MGMSQPLDYESWIEGLESRTMLSAGGLDTGFGRDGIAIQNPRSTADGNARAAALQADGKVVVVGDGSIAGARFPVVSRVNADGSVDTSFGIAGSVELSSGNSLECVAIQGDGKIVVGGAGGGREILLARLNANGSLDPTFGTGGVLIRHLPGANLNDTGDVTKIVFQRSGRIVIGAMENNDAVLARFNPDGSLDRTFGRGQTIVTSPLARVVGLAVTAGNKVVVASGFGPAALGIERYDRNGRLDRSFGNGGRAAGLPATFSDINAMAVRSDGAIVVAGLFFTPTKIEFALAGITSSGQLNRRFGTRGIARGQTRSRFNVNGMAFEPDGSLVAAGEENVLSTSIVNGVLTSTNINLFTVRRFTPQGLADTRFADGGFQTIANPTFYMGAGVLLRRGGRPLIPLTKTSATGPIQLLADNANGTPDASFGAAGIASVTPTVPGDDRIIDVAPAPNGDICALFMEGSSADGTQSVSLERFAPNGVLDTTLGTGGRLPVLRGTTNLAVQSDGKILVTGVRDPGDFSFVLTVTRYNAAGSLDTSFGSGGTTAAITLGAGLEVNFSSARLVQQHDGTILAMTSGTRASVYRFSASGALLSNASAGGMPEFFGFSSLTDLEFTQSGQFVVAGTFDFIFFEPTQLVLDRFNADLTPDTGFGAGGELMLPGRDGSGGRAVAIEADGSTIVAGFSHERNVLLRLTPAGTLDPAFAGGGIITTRAAIQSLFRLSDGKILAVASSGNDVQLFRYTPGGVRDTTFGVGGELDVNLGGAVTLGRSLLDANGKLLVSGSAATGARLSPSFTPSEGFIARFDVE